MDRCEYSSMMIRIGQSTFQTHNVKRVLLSEKILATPEPCQKHLKTLIDSKVGRMCLLAPLRILLMRDIGLSKAYAALTRRWFWPTRSIMTTQWLNNTWGVYARLTEHNLIQPHDFLCGKLGKPHRFRPNLSSITITGLLESRLVSQIITCYRSITT